MKLEELLGADYKDGMTAEEIAAALANRTFVDPTTLPASVSKDKFDKVMAEAAESKRKLAQLESAGATTEEQLKKALDEAAAMKREYAMKTSRMDAEKALIAAGLTEADYAPFIDTIVTEDAEATAAAAAGIAKMLSARTKAAEAAVRKEMQDKMPTPGADQKQPGMTKAEFDKLSFDEQNKFFTEHREEYNKMFE